jgi:hypothetical protein
MMSRGSRRGGISASVALILLAVSSCTSSSESSEAPGLSAAPGCDDATPIIESEVIGVATDATIYGLLFPTSPLPIRTGDELKIVWRMTGHGDLSVTYESPDGDPASLTFGPEAHGGSSYDRPGDEWGTGFKFDEPGCWHIHLERTEGVGDVWIEVVDR